MTGSPRFERLTGRCVRLDVDDVDTDQIIPARFLKTTDRAGLGENLFADWRKPGFALDRLDAKGAEILIAGRNFGCGSSREHAPWALLGAGFRAVVARSFADIFRQNALKNGLLPVALDEDGHARIADGDTLVLDLEAQTLTLPSGLALPFQVDAFARRCLLDGNDELGYLVARLSTIEEWEVKRR